MSSSAKPSSFQMISSPGLPNWLREQRCSLALSTYQLGKLFLIGTHQGERLSVFERTFNRCMGIWQHDDAIWLASAYQLWRLDNMLSPEAWTDDGYDRLYVPTVAHTTGDIDVHDLAVDAQGQVVFVNTLFSCLATIDARYSFRPQFRPPFISALAAEDRCHLNGLALVDGTAGYVTACAQTDSAQAWREHRRSGGCVMDVANHQVVADGLSMPHSPRYFQHQLWLLDSGRGYLGNVDLDRGTFEPRFFCPGYARGLSFVDHYAIVGLSRPRETTFQGLQLDEELGKHHVAPWCGIQVIDLHTGQVAEWLRMEGSVDELYDVIVLPNVARPKAFGLKTDDIRRNVWFEEGGTLYRWTSGDKDISAGTR